MGMHTGEPYLKTVPRPDYSGHPVNLAARVMGAAHGGQILLSNATYSLLHNQSLDAVTFSGLRSPPLERCRRGTALAAAFILNCRMLSPRSKP